MTPFFARELADEGAPRRTARGLGIAAVLGDMARPAKGFEVCGCVGVAPVFKVFPMMGFEPARLPRTGSTASPRPRSTGAGQAPTCAGRAPHGGESRDVPSPHQHRPQAPALRPVEVGLGEPGRDHRRGEHVDAPARRALVESGVAVRIAPKRGLRDCGDE